MLEHEIINIEDTICLLWVNQLLVSLLIRNQQENFIRARPLTNMLMVVFENLHRFMGQFLVKAHSFQLGVRDSRVGIVLIVEVKEASVF
jgi:hypothetical protein